MRSKVGLGGSARNTSWCSPAMTRMPSPRRARCGERSAHYSGIWAASRRRRAWCGPNCGQAEHRHRCRTGRDQRGDSPKPCASPRWATTTSSAQAEPVAAAGCRSSKLATDARQDLEALGRLTVPGNRGPVMLASVADLNVASGPAGDRPLRPFAQYQLRDRVVRRSAGRRGRNRW